MFSQTSPNIRVFFNAVVHQMDDLLRIYDQDTRRGCERWLFCESHWSHFFFSGVSSANFSVVIGGTDAGRTEITSNASIPEARLADFLHDVCYFRHCVLLNAQWPKTTF